MEFQVVDIRDNLRLAVDALRAHTMRAMLTALGLTMGVATLITVMTIVQGANLYVEKKIANLGTNVFRVAKTPFAVVDFTIVVKGRAAHSGINPEEGASAILEMSYQIQKLFALNDAARGITVNVGTIDGGIRSTVVAPEVRASVDVRVRTRADAVEVEAAIRDLKPVTPHTTVEIEGGIEQWPMEPDVRNQALWRRAQGLGRRLGLELDQAAVGGSSDGNTTSQYTATLDGLGAVGDGAHAGHEHAVIPRMVERCALLVLLLMSPPDASAPAAGHDQREATPQGAEK